MEELDAGRSVLIHWMAGVHRAPMCAAGTLAVLQGVSFKDAYDCYVLASGRYVGPRAFAQRVTRSGMTAIVRVIEEVKVVMRGGAVEKRCPNRYTNPLKSIKRQSKFQKDQNKLVPASSLRREGDMGEHAGGTCDSTSGGHLTARRGRVQRELNIEV